MLTFAGASRSLKRLLDFVRSDGGFRCAIVLGVAVRIVLAFATSNSYDLWFFGSVAEDGVAHRGLYADTTFSYPPLWGYFFQDAGKLLAFLHVPIFVHVSALEASAIPGLTKAELTTPLATMLLKLPALVADALLAYASYRAVLRFGFDRTAARSAALAWWLNPLALVTSPVQANWDSVIALAMLTAIVCAIEDRWLIAGAVIAIGVLAKLTPLYFVFLVPALVMLPPPYPAARVRLIARRLLFGAAGAVLAALAVVAPVAASGELGVMIAAIFERTGTFALGGANLLAFAALNEAHGFSDWVLSLRHAYALAASGAMLLGCSIVAVLLARRRSRELADYCIAAFSLFAVVCLSTPFAQPTYVLWLIPLAAIAAATGYARWWWPVWGLTACGFIFFITVRAIAALFEPSCVFFHFCDPTAFGTAVNAYRNALGFHANSLQVTIDVIAGETIGCCVLASFVFAVRFLSRPHAESGRTVISASRVPSRRLALAALVLVATCGASIVPYPPIPHFVISETGDRAILGAAGYSGTAYVTELLDAPPVISEIDVFFDPAYRSLRGVTATFANGFPAHFRDALSRRHIDVPLRVVDAVALREMLLEKPQGRMLFVLGGVLPDTVRGVRFDLLRPWLSNGGQLVWAGGPFDVVWARRGNLEERDAFGGPDYAPWPDLYSPGGTTIFGASVNAFAPPVAFGTYADLAWYGSRIRFARTTYPLNDGPLLKAGGRSLAYVDDRSNSSVSAFGIGRGTAVFFADAFDDEIVASETLAQLLFSGMWSPRVRYETHRGELIDGGAPMTIGALNGGASLRVFGDQGGNGPFADFAVAPQLSLDAERGRLVVNTEAYSGSIYAVVRKRRSARPFSTMFVYADARYADGRGVSNGFREATAALLRDDQRMRDQATNVVDVDAEQLRAVLERPVANDALVILGGVLPDTVRGKHYDLLASWLRAGGTVFWAGGPFDIVSATPASAAGASTISAPYADEWPDLYGAKRIFPRSLNLVAPPITRGTMRTSAWELWRGDFDKTTFPLNSGPLLARGGVPIGRIDAHDNSSVSVIPIGHGRVVFFGDAFDDPSDASASVAQVASTGVYLGHGVRLERYDGTLSPHAPPMTIVKLSRGDRVTVFGSNQRTGPFASAIVP